VRNNLTLQEQIELDKFLKESMEKGYIRLSQSPMASPFFFVDKKDGKLRHCQDYRHLNEHTIKMPISYQIIGPTQVSPTIHEIRCSMGVLYTPP
jgi:hypothetical protein